MRSKIDAETYINVSLSLPIAVVVKFMGLSNSSELSTLELYCFGDQSLPHYHCFFLRVWKDLSNPHLLYDLLRQFSSWLALVLFFSLPSPVLVNEFVGLTVVYMLM
jgi:hypothetical protein